MSKTALFLTLALGSGFAGLAMSPAPANAASNAAWAQSRVGGALTEAQARRECRAMLRGSRETRKARAARMEVCMRDKTVGGR